MDRLPSRKRSLLHIVLMLAALLMFSCALPGLSTQQPEPTPTIDPDEPLPPVLAEVTPLDGSQLRLGESIVFYFSQPMNRDSVEASLFGLPPGSLIWNDDSTLTFTPDSLYEIDSEITVAILSSAKAANGVSLTAPVSLTYHTPAPLRALNFLPEPGSQDIDPTAAVAVMFNQPVVPFGQDSDLPDGFSLTPPVNGRGEWLSTSTYVFYPEPALAGGETYTANLNTDLGSTSGAALDVVGSSLSWSFETALPRLVSVEPSSEQTLALDASIKLTFNQPMDPLSLENGFVFLGEGVPVNGEISWNDDHTEMTFEPVNEYERNSTYLLNITKDAAAASGTPIALEQQYQYLTYGDFNVQGSDPANQGTKAETGSVRVFFTAPPKNMDDLQEFVSVSPEIPNLSVSVNNTTMNINGFFTPESEYTLTISSDLLDIWEQPLGAEFELTFSAPAATPSLSVPFWGNVYFVRPDEPVLRANATNIRRADVSVAPITFEEFQVLTGPDGYEALQTFAPQPETAYSQAYSLTSSRSEPIALPLAGRGDVLETGLYFVSVDSPQLQQAFATQNPNDHRYLVAVSNLNLTFKIGATDALLWATDLRTGEPVSAPFTIYNNEGDPITSGETDGAGLWYSELSPLEMPGQTYTVVMSELGQDNFGAAQSSWSSGISPWDFGIPLRPGIPQPETYLYSDRPIYRPGQTVYFRGVVRQAFNGRYTLPEFSSVSLELQGNNGHMLQAYDLVLSPYGTFHGEYRLSPEAEPGYYTLRNEDINAHLSFTVAEYRKPEIELSVAFSREQVENGEQARAEAEAMYYFGSPAGEIDVQWTLFEQPAHFNLPGYQTGLYDDSWLTSNWTPESRFGRTLESGTDRTGADGTLDFQFPEIPESSGPRTITLEVTVQDESGFPVSARDEMTIHPADFYIGLRPDQWVGQSGTALGFDVFTANWDANASPSRALQAEFKQVRWERQDPPPEVIYGIPTYEPVYTLVSSSSLSTAADGRARLSFTPEEPGTYMLDAYGGGARTQILLWVTGRENASWPSLLNDQVKLTPDQEGYKPGQKANILIPNPFNESAQALVTVERGKVIRAEVIELGESGSTYPLDLTDEHAPNVYISATLLGPDNQFRQGYTELVVEPLEQELNVELTAEPRVNEPRGEVTLRLRVTDNAGEPVNGEFSLSMVDKAVLALADPNSPEILSAFYGAQSLGVSTGLSLAVYSGRYVLQPPGLGGGGGGAGILPVREEFPDTAYWNPTFITDSSGRAQVTVTLPDSLTTWSIESRGLTIDTRVGQADVEVVTTKPLLIRPVTPRFLVGGDHIEMAAIVHNNTNEELEVTVNLDTTGFTLDEPALASQIVEVPAKGRTHVSWWGRAEEAEQAELVFAVSGRSGTQTLSDAATPPFGPLPIRQYIAPQTFVTAGMLTDRGSRQEIISLPRTFSPTGGRLDVEMSPSLAASILKSLEVLPPPFCTCNNEAVLSYFLPNLETYRAFQASGIENPILKARLDESLNDSIAALVRNQNMDGGWGWIRGNDSDPYISTYILFGLGRARRAGISIPDETFNRVQGYLREYALSDPTLDTYQAWELDRLTFTFFALSQTSGLQESDLAILNAMYEKRDQLSPWAQALLALGFEAISPSNSSTRDLIANLEATAIRTGSSSNWESESVSPRNPGTPLYTTAVVAYVLAQRDPAATVLIEAVRYLSSNREAQGLWGSTYEDAWVILALTEAMKGFGELQADFSFSASLNDAQIVTGGVRGTEIFTPVSATVPLEYLSPSSPNALVIERESGLGRLYYRASLLLNRPVELVQPLNKGMNLNRAYFDAGCRDAAIGLETRSTICSPLSSIELVPGTQLTARLTLTVPNDSYYVSLEDFIPAGTEILDQSLKTSQQGQEGTDVQIFSSAEQPIARGWGWWLFDEPQIHDERIIWTADYLPAGTYELTYTLIPTQAGQFQVLPAHAWQTFFPDVEGTSAGMIFEIR